MTFVLIFSGIFIYMRGTLHPYLDPYDPQNIENKRYRQFGALLLLIGCGLTIFLYTIEPKVHIVLAE